MVLEHRGYGAYIKCGDGPLEEFAVTEEDESTLMCYICSEPGKFFEVHYEDYGIVESSEDAAHVEGKLSKEIEVFVDGKISRSVAKKHGKPGSILGSRTGVAEIVPYVFEEIIEPDDKSSSSTTHLGCIEVRIKRTLGFKAKADPKTYKITEASPVTETGEGLGSHFNGTGVVLKEEMKWGQPIKYDKKPYVRFKFYYNTQEVLQVHGIVPLPPDPEPELADIEGDPDSEDENEVFQEEIEEMERRQTKAKVEVARANLALAQALLDEEQAELDHAKARGPKKKRAVKESSPEHFVD